MQGMRSIKNFYSFLFIIFFCTFIFLNQSGTIFAQEHQVSSDSASIEEQVATSSSSTDFVPPPNTQPVSLTISPSTLLLETDPGTPITSSFQVFNNSTEDEYLKVSLLKFNADETGSAPVLREFVAEDEYKDWLKFNVESFVVEPNTWETIQVTFSPPEYAALSYYYAIVVSRQSSLEPQEGETAVIGAPALLTLVTVRSPYAKQELQLKSFRATKKLFEFLPVEFELVVQNTGNIHIAPIGNIFIDGLNKKGIGLIEINKSNGLILPGSTRTYTLSWEDGFPKYVPESKDGKMVLNKDGTHKNKLQWDFSQAHLLRIGKFTGHLIFIYDNGIRDIPTEAKVSFWVFPIRIILVLFIIISLAATGILLPLIWIIKKMRKRI